MTLFPALAKVWANSSNVTLADKSGKTACQAVIISDETDP